MSLIYSRLKKILSIMLSVVLLAEMLSTVSYALESNRAELKAESASNIKKGEDEDTISGTCGEDVVWELNEKTGVLTISGKGAMYDYEYYNSYGGYVDAPWWGGPLTYWNRTIKKVVVSDGVTNVGDYAFYRCKGLTDVKLGKDVEIIGEASFFDSDSLKEIELPDGLTTIEERAFRACDGLSNIFIPQNVSHIADGDFGSNIKSINVSAENGFYSSVDGMLFNDDATKFLRCPKGKEGTVNIPVGVTYIAEGAFSGCQKITAINIPSTTEKIEGVGESYSEMFAASCFELSHINVVGENEIYFSIDGILCNKIEKSVLAYPTGKKDIQIYRIPKNLVKIESKAFHTDNLLGIVIPNTITDIEENAFSGCGYLTDIYFAADKETWDKIFRGNEDEVEGVTIHYNSTGPDDPGIGPEESMGFVGLLSNWNSSTGQAYFDYSPLAYSVTDNTQISSGVSIEQLVGKYVLVKRSTNDALEISSMKPVDSQIGTVTDVIVGNGDSGTTSLQFDDGTYVVVSGLFVPEDIIGKQVLYHLCSDEIVGYAVLQKKTGTLEEWNSVTGKLVIDGSTYYTNYMTDEQLFTSVENLRGRRVEILYQEGIDVSYTSYVSYVFQIEEAKEEYRIQIYASTPNLSINIGRSIDIVCSLYRDGKIVENWKDPAFVIGNDRIISMSDYQLKDGSYCFTITGLSVGRSSLTVSDSYSGAYVTADISVGQAVSQAYSYRMDHIPSFVPNVYGESVLTNFYNVNGLYVNNFSYSESSDGGYDVSFNVYNQGYMYGAVDVYSRDGTWLESKKIDKFSDISSIWDTGEALVYLVGDSVDGRLLSYTSGILSKYTPISVHVPKDGYFVLSNNFSTSPGTFLYNTVDYLMLSVNTITDVGVNGVESGMIAEDIVGKAIEDIDFQYKFMEQFNEIALNVSKTALEFGIGQAAESITVDAENLLTSANLDWKNSAKSVVNGLESVFSDLAGPIGKALDGCFELTKLSSYVVQTNDICYSTYAPSVLIHAPTSGSNTTTVEGVTVTTDTGDIDSEVVLQVFRIANTDAIEFVDGEIPVEEYKLYNICFIKNGEEVRPNGQVTVKIPIPSGYDKDECVVYRQEPNGEWVILQAFVEGNYLVFETDHFSLYAIAEAGVDHIHTPGEAATCTTPQVCTVCGAELAPAIGHQKVKTEAKAATCTEHGNTEYWHCEICGKYFSDEALNKEISREDTLVKAKGHGKAELKNQKDATCIAEGYTGDMVCKDCGEVLAKGESRPKLIHIYKDGKCSICGATDFNFKPTASVPPIDLEDQSVSTETPNVENPQTGDNSNMVSWILMFVVLGCAVIGIVVYGKKKGY